MNRIILILIILALSMTKAFSCDCIGKDSVNTAMKKSSIVIKGTIISKETITRNDTFYVTNPEDSDSTIYPVPLFTWYLNKYRVVVTEKYKGKNITDTITIMTGVGGGDCGFPFDLGKDYIIYGISENLHEKKYLNAKKGETSKGVYWTDICTRTTLYSDKERTSILTK